MERLIPIVHRAQRWRDALETTYAPRKCPVMCGYMLWVDARSRGR